ncbi:hypothetical protein NQ043_09575 [Staphylococcus hyicus]|uniref:hypothetical protein n=1 Tax=Staphylococcus hyicus TaxID=1284 RepID=UPI00211C0B99|nr:hypothetical protein [Staphylococcus hyicus]MCQ9301375.1 hypothetical protein [Staphylococcus hyicus]
MIEVKENKRITSIIRYDGFSEPFKIAYDLKDLYNNIEIVSNYLGDITNEFKEVLNDELKHMSINILSDFKELTENQLDELNEQLAYYNIYVMPTVIQLQDKNYYSYGLARNTNLEKYIY